MSNVFRRAASRDDGVDAAAEAAAMRAVREEMAANLSDLSDRSAAGAGRSPWGWMVAIAVLAALAFGLRRIRSDRALEAGTAERWPIAPAADVPVEAPVAEAPAVEAPVAEAPADDPPAAAAAAAAAPAEEAPADGAPGAVAPAEEAPAEEAPAAAAAAAATASAAAPPEGAPAEGLAADAAPANAAPGDEIPVAAAAAAAAGEAPASAEQAGKHKRRQRMILEFVLTLAIAVGAVLLIELLVVKPYKIPTGSMEPTLAIGQRVLVNRLDTTPSIGDVVVFHPPAGAIPNPPVCGNRAQGADNGIVALLQPCDQPTAKASNQTYIKRVVGLPGDVLQVIGGHVYRNGKRESDAYIRSCGTASICTFAKSIRVPAGMYYMMGDNRGISDDSRFWGPVPKRWIVGVAFMTYWPPDRIGTL
jgi:signal peptidase I